MKQVIIFLFVFLLTDAVTLTAQNRNAKEITPAGMIKIPSGFYKPLYSYDKQSNGEKVESFFIDKYPVTNKEFLDFVIENPRWQKSNVRRLFADESYLFHWKSDTVPGDHINLSSPVTNVSWFAAKAYCDWKGKRLPTLAEWEYVAAASMKSPNANLDESYKAIVVEWLSKPFENGISVVGQNPPNYYGAYDMQGLIWEWVSDYNNALVTGDSRSDAASDRDLFCGSGALGATNFDDYTAFIRYAFRSSLQANYTVHNLGFRCAR